MLKRETFGAALRRVWHEGKRRWRDQDWHPRAQTTIAIAALGVTLIFGISALIGRDQKDGDSLAPPASAPQPSELTSQPAEQDRYLGGWGPDRPTFTGDNPAEKPILNSITDNPAEGDERNFVRCRLKGQEDADFGDAVAVPESSVVVIYVVIDNAATSKGNDVEGARFYLLGEGEFSDPGVGVQLEATNAPAVWDGCQILTDRPATVAYIPGSAQLTYGTRDDTRTLQLTDRQVVGEELFPDTGSGSGVIPAAKTTLGYVTMEVLVRPHV